MSDQLTPPAAGESSSNQESKEVKKASRPWYKKPVPVIIFVLVAVGVINSAGGESNPPSDSGNTAVSSMPTNINESTPSPTVAIESTPAPSETAEATPEVEAPVETVSQSNASESAESYLAYSGFSRSGLIEQLEYEGYSNEDATYGVDAQNADWNEQATRSAKSYLDYSSFSRSGLIDQLMYEGYSQSEAEYGATANGL